MKEIKIEDFNKNIFNIIGKDWMLISTKSEDIVNTMTASWGGMGVLWHKNVVYIFIRPQRYTYELMEKTDLFTLSFFNGNYRDELTYFGRNSGRNEDKIEKMGFKKIIEDEFAYFEESELVIKCKKLHKQQISPDGFIDKKIDEFYKNDYHFMYVAEILSINEK